MRGIAIVIAGLAWALPETWLAIGLALIVAAAVLLWSCCVLAGRADDRAEGAYREGQIRKEWEPK